MWLADGWKDYQVIDCSKGEKLERWGEYLLVRPDPQVIWDTPKTINCSGLDAVPASALSFHRLQNGSRTVIIDFTDNLTVCSCLFPNVYII